jgi:hypothetical protein
MKKRSKKPPKSPFTKPPMRRSFTKDQRNLAHGTNRRAFKRLDAQAQANQEFGQDTSGGAGGYGYGGNS